MCDSSPLRPGFTVAEVEPLGVYRFTRESRRVSVDEDAGNVTLSVQRLYGARGGRSVLSYATAAGSATPGEDFGAVADGRVAFDSPFQTNASLLLAIVNDSLAEPDEFFYVNLTDVRVLGAVAAAAAAPGGPRPRPRLDPAQSVARVTIRASTGTGGGDDGGGDDGGGDDGGGGVLSIGPALVHTEEDREQGGTEEKRVELRVRRAAGPGGVGLDAPVSVRVHAYGGGLMLLLLLLLLCLG